MKLSTFKSAFLARGKRAALRAVGATAGLAVVLATAHLVGAQEPDPAAEAIRGVNTAWVLITAFLVFFMQAGFAFVESGLTRAKNTTNILMKNLMDFVMATLGYWAIGFGLMFGQSNGGLFGTSYFFIGADAGDFLDMPILAFWLFQLVFAGTAATIVSGAMAERTKFSAYLVYSLIISLLIYPIFGHWVWGSGWLWTLGDSTGLVPGGGFRDFAGSTVVHSVGGWAALMGAVLLGPRIGRFGKDGRANFIPGHSVSLFVLGIFILWLGWFGFNPGSQLAIAGGNADAVALVAANTNIAAAAGALTALITAWLRGGKPDVAAAMNGVLAGLVAITAPCAYVTPLDAVIIGAVAGPIVVFGNLFLEKLQIDDPVGAIPVHLMNGVWGTLAIGLFGSVNGVTGVFAGGGFGQLIIQLIGVLACGAWTAGTSFILFFAIKSTIGLRVSTHEEMIGLDLLEHGSTAYPGDVVPGLIIRSQPKGGQTKPATGTMPAK
ncbi:MAG: ammonium transporter [Anaerolineae bacterium]|nr:ammonium transporter [Thermoflexales bacterium]MDW8406315.1 ammonium transporter [Anaerolineae bacterium]